MAVLIVDLDRFKELNDTLSHHSGDELLRQIGPRLSGALRPVDTLARLEATNSESSSTRRRIRRMHLPSPQSFGRRLRSRSMFKVSRSASMQAWE